MWHFPSSERRDKRSKAGGERGREKNGPTRLGHQPSNEVRGGPAPGQGLDDHGLQEAEAHHEVKRDGWLQEVAIQPQVAQVWHIFQVRREVMEGHYVVGANLCPVDFYGERGGEKSAAGSKDRRRRGGQPRMRALELSFLELADFGNMGQYTGHPNVQTQFTHVR
jgi:hypothetical protein